eukprot:CAMPEP_0201979396 /NCGR_PEP_ID=MMETSP0904-20121228/67109_1 /ASSEMBLY_ACC=CAM_ASM_000553 /TAXON_ID=420261 /ORGANISM="Thalassiosira antarctica, Strain CCMP982" /LENGTH=126 /DNA_ID=CAMNT_0048531381 /DNA_START=214 /DNA_END=594 /DNA_ORIENTATION=+
MYNTQKSNFRLLKSHLLITATALGLSILPLQASAEITQDCILEGTVDMRKAEELGQPVYVNFRNARRGTEAGCNLNRRSKSRRVQFISSPDTANVEDAVHGSKVRYRYIERDNQSGNWELLDAKDS